MSLLGGESGGELRGLHRAKGMARGTLVDHKSTMNLTRVPPSHAEYFMGPRDVCGQDTRQCHAAMGATTASSKAIRAYHSLV